PALADTSTTYSGRGVGARGTLNGVEMPVADTGQLPSTGGELDASQLTDSVPGVLGGEVFNAWVLGASNVTSAESSAGAISLTVGTDTVTADFAMADASAV